MERVSDRESSVQCTVKSVPFAVLPLPVNPEPPLGFLRLMEDRKEERRKEGLCVVSLLVTEMGQEFRSPYLSLVQEATVPLTSTTLSWVVPTLSI